MYLCVYEKNNQNNCEYQTTYRSKYTKKRKTLSNYFENKNFTTIHRIMVVFELIFFEFPNKRAKDLSVNPSRKSECNLFERCIQGI